MKNEETSPKTYFYMLHVIHAGFIVVLLLFLSVIFYMNAARQSEGISGSDIVMWLLLFFTFAGIVLSFWVYRLRVREAGKAEHFKSKLAAYQTALVIRWAMLDITALMMIVAYSITGSYVYFFITILIIAVLVWSRATKQRLIADMHLDHIERTLIERSGGKDRRSVEA